MAKSKLPDALGRRHLVERDLNPAQAMRIAQAYLDDGRSLEAIAFLCKAEAADQLEALRAEAIECGDAFMLRAVSDAAGLPPGREEWQALAAKASAVGKDLYAAEAIRQAERGED